MKVLLLGGGLQALAFGEALYGHDNMELSVLTDEYDVSHSRFFHNVYGTGNQIIGDALENVLKSTKIDIVVPMGDVSAVYLSKNKNVIEKNYGVYCAVANYEILSLVADKGQFMSFCESNDIPHPKTAKLTENTLEEAAQKVGFPSLIKPNVSVGAKGIVKVENRQDLLSHWKNVNDKYGSCTLQEFIDNQDYYFNVMIYRNRHGICEKAAVIKIVRMYPVKAGSSCCCISVENVELIGICSKVLEKLDWIGMADFDVLQRKDNGEYKIIEVNPRVPASLRAATASGISFPSMIVNDAFDKPYEVPNYRTGVVLRYMGLDLMWLIKSKRLFKAKPSWFRFFGKNIYYQDIYKKDVSTWYSWIVTGIRKLVKHS